LQLDRPDLHRLAPLRDLARSWPQAAAMSLPRLSRTKAEMPRDSSRSTK
jgi:hypothetical protein